MLVLVGMGANMGKQCIQSQFPEFILHNKSLKIHHLELIALVVVLKTWAKQLAGNRFVVLRDNQAVVEVVNSGNSKDKILQTWLRELIFIAATSQFEIYAKYIASLDNKIPDVLSRICKEEAARKKWKELKQQGYYLIPVDDNLFKLQHFW